MQEEEDNKTNDGLPRINGQEVGIGHFARNLISVKTGRLPLELEAQLMYQPISNVGWVHRDNLSANLYNPNRMAPPEKQLLITSIVEDGWVFPILTLPQGVKVEGLAETDPDKYTIIDGFHRYLTSGDMQVYQLTGGYVPIVHPNGKDFVATTVRMNRIKGTHTVIGMADIILFLLQQGKDMEYIMQEYGMEQEEVVRLANTKGIPKTDLIAGTDFSKSWTPGATKS